MTQPTEVLQLEASIRRVWSEPDDQRRLEAMREIYHQDAQIFEPTRSVAGHEAISAVVRDVLKDLPPGFVFNITGPTLGHHGVAITRWEGVADGKVIVSGSDAARISDGLIIEHYFYFNPPQ
jgi:hypothetical protein